MGPSPSTKSSGRLAAKRVILEVAVASVEGAVAAFEGGADRLEISAALELGGVTPSLGLLREIAQAVSLPTIVMLRPRAGGFTYSPCEFRTIQRDCEIALSDGATGIAFGLLRPNRQIDADRCREVVRQAGPAQTVFHRAFDLLADPIGALNQLVDLGITRILTAGGQPTALEGASTLAELLRHASNRIEILPGGGIRAQNVRDLVARTGCSQVHGSFSEIQTEQAGHIQPASFPVTSAQQVAAVRARLDLM
jgi:copper homeostasis protein